MVIKNKIHETINIGNSILNKGNIVFGLKIKPELVEEYNISLRELKDLNYTSNNLIQDIQELEIVKFEELITEENNNPTNIFKKIIFAYWTGDIFLSKQTSIKSYVRSTNMTLDLLLHTL